MSLNASIVVTTKAHFESGDKSGIRLDLADFDNKEDFMREAKRTVVEELDATPDDLYLTDFESYYEDIDTYFIDVNNIDERIWQLVHADSEDIECLCAYIRLYGSDILDADDLEDSLDKAKEQCQGHYYSEAEFAKESLNELNGIDIEKLPNYILQLIDWDDLWEEEYSNDYSYDEATSLVFRDPY